MWVTHSGSSDSYTVYIKSLSAIRAVKVADNNRNSTFFSIPILSHGNPRFRDWKSGPEFEIPGLQSLDLSELSFANLNGI